MPPDDNYNWGAVEADFSKPDLYEVSDPGSSKNKKLLFPLRVRLQEDRIMGLEKRFFCDRTTEKTVTLRVRGFLIKGLSNRIFCILIHCSF